MNELTGLKLWSLIAIFTFFIAATYGFGIYLFPAIAPEMMKDIKFTYTEMGITSGVVQASFLGFALVSGLLTNWIGAFRIIKGSVILCALSLLALIWADSFILISFLLIIMGGCAASVWIPMVEVCQNYISPNHQGRALGLMSSGTSYGVFINSILIYYFLNDLGWRSIWTITFAFVAIVCICAFFILKNLEHQNTQTEISVTNQPVAKINFLNKIQSLPKKTTGLIIIMMLLNGLSCIPYQTYLTSLLVDDHNLSVDESASAWRFIGFMGMFGGFLMGWVADRITVRWTLVIVYLLLSISTSILLYVEITTVSIYLAAVLFGLSFYAIFGLLPAYISHVYRNKTAALVFAFGSAALGLGGVIGNTVGGWLKEEYGTFESTYTIVLIASLGSLLLSIVMHSERSLLSKTIAA